MAVDNLSCRQGPVKFKSMEIIYSLRSKALNIFILIRQQFKKNILNNPIHMKILPYSKLPIRVSSYPIDWWVSDQCLVQDRQKRKVILSWTRTRNDDRPSSNYLEYWDLRLSWCYFSDTEAYRSKSTRVGDFSLTGTISRAEMWSTASKYRFCGWGCSSTLVDSKAPLWLRKTKFKQIFRKGKICK